jgi:RNA polymerase sigma-70 factor, ECF subfamily
MNQLQDRRTTSMEHASRDLTVLLAEVSKGNERAVSELLPLVYDELRQLAARYMNRERINHTLQPTALVHEAYIKLVQHPPDHWKNRAHFFGIAAQVMRQVLVDHARGHGREKRGAGQEFVRIENTDLFSPERSSEFLKLDESLRRLTKLDARQGKIVELRFFGGLTVGETARVLGISPKTVRREWSMAKAWLHGDLRKGNGEPSEGLGKD